jgi:hypothetical protein
MILRIAKTEPMALSLFAQAACIISARQRIALRSYVHGPPNKSLDASGGSVFRIIKDAAMVA